MRSTKRSALVLTGVLTLTMAPLAATAQARTTVCSSTSHTPGHSSTQVWGTGDILCSVGTGTLQVNLQQYRGAGYWATKASKTVTSNNNSATAVWTCAAGTGSQLYRTNSGGGGISGSTSAQVRYTCPS